MSNTEDTAVISALPPTEEEGDSEESNDRMMALAALKSLLGKRAWVSSSEYAEYLLDGLEAAGYHIKFCGKPKKQKLSRKVLKAKIQNLQRGQFRLKVSLSIPELSPGRRDKYVSIVVRPDGTNHVYQWGADGTAVTVALSA
jgi:hypothetical protein